MLVTVPETAGRSLESMDRLFELPRYKVGLYGKDDTEQRDLISESKLQERELEAGVGEKTYLLGYGGFVVGVIAWMDGLLVAEFNQHAILVT